MSNRQYIKKKPQPKAFSPSGGCSNYLSPDDSGNMDNSSMGTMYEQIKGEVVSSVLNWLSMYMAADQEDKKVSELTVEPAHCCECTLNKRIQKSNSSSMNSSFSNTYNKYNFDTNYLSPDNNMSKYVDVTTYTGEDNDIIKVDNVSDTPEDLNMILTDFRAGQVWPDWCNYLEKAVGKHSNGDLANSQVYYDKFNDRLCVYRRGLVEYPQLRKTSPRIETSGINFKQNLNSIPEVKESLLRNWGDLRDRNLFSSGEYSNESDKYLINLDNKSKDRLQNLTFGDDYTGLNVDQIATDSIYGNYSNMVKWMSLPNVQFQ